MLQKIMQAYADHVLFEKYNDYFESEVEKPITTPNQLKDILSGRLLGYNREKEADQFIMNCLNACDFKQIFDNCKYFYSPVIKDKKLNTPHKILVQSRHLRNEALFKLYGEFIPDLKALLAKAEEVKDIKGKGVADWKYKNDVAVAIDDLLLMLAEISHNIHNSVMLSFDGEDALDNEKD